MNQSENLSETQLEIWFSSLREISPRDPGAARRGRQDFLAQASAFGAPVSFSENGRHTGWIGSLVNRFKHKELSPMYTTIASFIVVLALMVGGSGVTAFAAQNSLPNQSLYQIKTFTEDLALHSMQRNEHRLQVELNYSDRRVLEMVRLREMQQVVPESTITRWENHLDQSLLIAANSESNEMLRALNQIRERLENQAGLLASCPDQDPLQVRLREMIQTRIAWTELGLDDPNEFHQQAQVRKHFNQAAKYEHQAGFGPGPNPDPDPGEGAFGPGPGAPEFKYEECRYAGCGPGPDKEFDNQLQIENQHQVENQHQYGPGPENDSEQNQGPDHDPANENTSGPAPAANQNQNSGQENQNSSSSGGSSQGSGASKGNGGNP
jgi:uncharacterized membrane protein YgcG